MKAVVINKPGEMFIADKPIPEPQPGFARIKVAAAAVCATDLEVIDGNIPANYPLTPGMNGAVLLTVWEAKKTHIGSGNASSEATMWFA